jgi:OmpA-OmpF porin, OOP family
LILSSLNGKLHPYLANRMFYLANHIFIALIIIKRELISRFSRLYQNLMSKLFLSAITLFASLSLCAQSIQWNQSLLPADVTRVANDSTEQGSFIFKSRWFLYDSVQSVSTKTGIPFFDHGYLAVFKTPQEINHLVINFKNASRLIYYIRLFDEQGGSHIVYNYGAIHPCDAATESLLLTIAHTPYKVKKIEIGTFLGKDDVIKLGISNEPDGNKVIEELLSQRLTALCNKTSFFTEKIPLHQGINSSSAEVKPVISPDGKTLYFHRQNFKGNVGGKKDDQDIYMSRLKDNAWSDAENMKAPLNDNLPNGIASVSSGETSVFLINEYLGVNQQRQGLSSSEKTVSGWSTPKKIEVKNFYNRSQYMDYFISPTQNEMILAIQRDDSYGDQDLYVSFFDDMSATWTEPLNLGPEVNSILSEASPFLASDGKTLYFASDGALGYGGFDIYVTHRLDDSWINWSIPENLGPIINSFDHDLYYTVSAAGDQAYFVSTVNGDRNIFRMALPLIYKPEPVVLLSGKIFNQSTTQAEEANVVIRFYGDTEIIGSGKSDPVTGEYKIVLPAGGIYDYKIQKPGFHDVSGTISTLKTKSYEEKTQHIQILTKDSTTRGKISIPVKLSKNTNITNFITNTANFLNAFPQFSLTITGSIDDSTKTSQVSSINDLKSQLLYAGAPHRKISINEIAGRTPTMEFVCDSLLVNQEVVIIPENYLKPERNELSDVSVLLKGKIIDAKTLRPVASRMVFKVNDKIKSRSSSDPVTGKFQTLLPSGAKSQVVLFIDSSQHQFTYEAPKVKQYEELNQFFFINIDPENSIRLEVGTGFSANRDEIAQRKLNSFLRKKKATRQLLNTKKQASGIHQRFEEDLIYIAEILKNIPNAEVKILTHRSTKIKDESFEITVADRVSKVFESVSIEKSRLSIEHKGTNSPKNPKVKHHSNNRIEVEVLLK